MKPARARLSRQHGFTLLELLIAITLTGLLLGMLYGGLRITTQAWDKGEARAEAVADVYLVQRVLRRQISQARNLFHQEKRRGRVLAFKGEEDMIEFVSPFLEYQLGGGLYFNRIELERTDKGQRLVLRWWPYRASYEDDPEPVTEVLLENVEQAAFSYHPGGEDGSDGDWEHEWEESRMPALVRLEATLEGRRWPLMIVALAQ